jgi:hypothetical protein
MKALLTATLLWAGLFAALGQGTVNFVNRITGSLDAPVFDTDGSTRLSGSGFRAALYVGTPSTPDAALTAIGNSLPFRSGAGAGYVDSTSGSARTLPGIPEGGTAKVQVRAWDATRGATYEAARAAGGKTGGQRRIHHGHRRRPRPARPRCSASAPSNCNWPSRR